MLLARLYKTESEYKHQGLTGGRGPPGGCVPPGGSSSSGVTTGGLTGFGFGAGLGLTCVFLAIEVKLKVIKNISRIKIP